MRKKVTSTDIAKAAGVSQATVSMVLNKKYNVSFSKATIEKVEQAAKIVLVIFLLLGCLVFVRKIFMGKSGK